MNDNLISEIIDLTKVKANLTELQKMWEQLIVNMAAKSGKDLKFDNLAQNLKTVITAETELANVKKANLELDKKIAAAQKQQEADSKKRITQAEKEAKAIEVAAQKEAAAQNKAIDATIAARKKQAAALEKQVQKHEELIKAANKEVKSLGDLNGKLAARRKLIQDLEFGTDAYNEMAASISELAKQQDIANSELGIFNQRVGNYQDAVDTANLSLGEMKKELRELRNMSFANLKPEEITQIRDRMAELTDAVGDFQSQINTASQDRIPALMDGLQGLVAVAQGVTGTLAIFGVETEKLDKAMVQLIGVSQALETIQELQEKGTIRVMWATVKDTAAKAANAVAAKGQAMATTGATAATRALGKAMMTSPYIAIAAAIAAVTVGVVLLVKAFKEQDGAMKKVIENANKAAGEIQSEQFAMNQLFESIKKTNVGSIERKKLTAEMNDLYKDYLPSLLDEKTSLEDINKAQIAANDSLKANIFMKAKRQELESVESKLAELYTEQRRELEIIEKINSGEITRIKSSTRDNLVEAEGQLTKINSRILEQEKLWQDITKYYDTQIPQQIELTKEQQAAQEAYNKAIELKNESEKRAKESADKLKNAYTTYNQTITNINNEARISIQLGEDKVEVMLKEIQAIYEATKAYFELNGYTADEIKKLKELRAEIEKLSTEIANTPKLIDKSDVEAVKSVAKVTGEISMNMRDVAPAVNDTAAGFTKLEVISAKLRNAFNDFFGTEPIEDWRDTFVDSMTTAINESVELFNQVVDMQSEQLDQELDTLDTLFDKQMSILDATYDRRKSLLEATIDDETELAAALARIEEEKAAVQNKFQDAKFKKEQEIARKQAILQRKKAAMEVAAGSATALVDAIKLIGIATTAAAPGDPYSLVARIAAALAAALTVVGAVTAGIAKVKAIEIPQFFTGGEAQEGQIISVAERGKEIAVGESGKSYMFDRQSVIVAPEKMRIFSNKETKQIMEKQTINNNYEKQSNVNLTVNIDNERHKKYFKLN